MADGERARQPNIFSSIRYRDARAAMAWMTETLGFKPGLDVPAPDGGVAHAELHFGPGVVMVGDQHDRIDPAKPWEAANRGLYIAVDDIDVHYARAKAAGAEIVMDLHDTEYGSRDYAVRDPEGNDWFFGTYRPGDI